MTTHGSKRTLSWIPLALVLALVSGCGKSDDSASSAPALAPAPSAQAVLDSARAEYIRVVIQDRNAHQFTLDEKTAACDHFLEAADQVILLHGTEGRASPAGRHLFAEMDRVRLNRHSLIDSAKKREIRIADRHSSEPDFMHSANR